MRTIVIGLVLIFTYILEITILQHIRVIGVLPNLMVIIVVSFGLLRGQREGVIIGILGGLLYDITFGFGIGGKALMYGVVGYVCGKLSKDIYRENFIIPFVCTLGASLFISLFPILRFIMLGKINFVFFLRTIIIPEMIYTVMLSLVIYRVTYIINEKIELKEKRTRNIF